jgi:hypothetical protein
MAFCCESPDGCGAVLETGLAAGGFDDGVACRVDVTDSDSILGCVFVSTAGGTLRVSGFGVVFALLRTLDPGAATDRGFGVVLM